MFTLFVIGGMILALYLSVVCRIIFMHPINSVRYAIKDLYFYVKHKQKNLYKTGDIIAYTGLFGRGKTLSAVHKVVRAYKRYNDKIVWCPRRKCFVKQKVKVISNVDLTIPYEQFVSLGQIYQCAQSNQVIDDLNNTLTVTLILGDEFSVQLNSRSFKDNINGLFLNTLLTCRHHHISLYYTAQRFGHVDALLRQVTSKVVECRKVWRCQAQYIYDAWEMENASNPKLIKPLRRTGWFVKDVDYNSYDTLACVKNLQKSFNEGDMMSSEEILQLQCNNPVGLDGVTSPSRKLKKRWKK